MTEGDLKSLMDNLGDLAGLDMVLLREAGFDRDAEPLRSARPPRSGWIGALWRAVEAPRRAAAAALECCCLDRRLSSLPPSGETSPIPSTLHADHPISHFLR